MIKNISNTRLYQIFEKKEKDKIICPFICETEIPLNGTDNSLLFNYINSSESIDLYSFINYVLLEIISLEEISNKDQHKRKSITICKSNKSFNPILTYTFKDYNKIPFLELSPTSEIVEEVRRTRKGTTVRPPNSYIRETILFWKNLSKELLVKLDLKIVKEKIDKDEKKLFLLEELIKN